MWTKPLKDVKRPSLNMQVEDFLTQALDLWIGTEEITKALRISEWQLRHWRQAYGLPCTRLPSGHLCLPRALFYQWLMVRGQLQLEEAERYRKEKYLPKEAQIIEQHQATDGELIARIKEMSQKLGSAPAA